GSAARTQEWRNGIGRLFDAPPSDEVGKLLEPYLAAVRAENPLGLKRYPGSPLIARALCREQDRMVFCELHPEEYLGVKGALGKDRRAKLVEIDGWLALKAYVPPKERRGLVLIDPPFEEPGEFERLGNGVTEAHRRWATGIFLLWYPVKDADEVRTFERRLARLDTAKILRVEFAIDTPRPDGPLAACKLLIVNPPFPLQTELNAILSALAACLGRDGKGRCRIDWLAFEQ